MIQEDLFDTSDNTFEEILQLDDFKICQIFIDQIES